MGITADFSGAIAKTMALKAVPQAAKRQATQWASQTVQDLKRSASQQQKSWFPGQAKGQMSRNIGMQVGVSPGLWTIAIGTGVGNTVSVKYAKIQDEGGVTHPRVTPKMRRFAWAMAYGGAAARAEKKFRAVFKRAGRGMARTAGAQAGQRTFGMWRAIALTDKATLTVHIPASHWFTSVIDRREPALAEMMSPEVVFNVASQMTGGKG
jgi:hypothetical protein